jgi:hypothetical protein
MQMASNNALFLQVSRLSVEIPTVLDILPLNAPVLGTQTAGNFWYICMHELQNMI